MAAERCGGVGVHKMAFEQVFYRCQSSVRGQLDHRVPWPLVHCSSTKRRGTVDELIVGRSMVILVFMTTWFTLSEAADISNRSRVTLRRYLDQGRFPNARRDESDVNRPWLVSLEDLTAAGVSVTSEPDLTVGVSHTGDAEPLAVAQALAEERLEEIKRLTAVVDSLLRQCESMASLLVHGRDRPSTTAQE